MASTYASLADLRRWRRITATNPDVDGQLESVLAAASRAIDRKTARRFWLDPTPSPRAYGVTGRTTPDGLLLVDDIGSTDGLLVEVGGGSSWSTVTDYDAEPGGALAQGEAITGLRAAHWGFGRVRVTARWGWPEVPTEITEATLLLANRLHMRIDSPEGIAASGEWGAVRLSRWDPDVEALVAPYILPGFA